MTMVVRYLGYTSYAGTENVFTRISILQVQPRWHKPSSATFSASWNKSDPTCRRGPIVNTQVKDLLPIFCFDTQRAKRSRGHAKGGWHTTVSRFRTSEKASPRFEGEPIVSDMEKTLAKGQACLRPAQLNTGAAAPLG